MELESTGGAGSSTGNPSDDDDDDDDDSNIGTIHFGNMHLFVLIMCTTIFIIILRLKTKKSWSEA